MWRLAQEMPKSELLQGSAQDVLSWVVLALVVLFVAACIFFIRKLNHWEEKYDNLQKKTTKIAIRSQRAIEVLADLTDPEVEEDLED